MDLWIRTQNKKALVKVDNLHVDGYYIYSANTILAKYYSEERAIEVLDEIFKSLITNKTINGDYEKCDLQFKSLIVTQMIKVWQMPEK